MSDVEGDVGAAQLVSSGPMDLNSAIQEVLKNAAVVNGLYKGLRECCIALDKRKALLCLLANNCDEPNYLKLIEALCAEHGIKLLRVDSNKVLGEWAGLCKFDREGKARKVVGCSSVVITDWGAENQGYNVIKDYIKNRA